jgi:RNA polymerase sigma-70 factor (ECF subfamily)
MRIELNVGIRDFVEQLPSNYRAVLVLSDMVGLPNHEIADVLGLRLDVVKIRLHRARARLRKEIETHCNPDEWLPAEWL